MTVVDTCDHCGYKAEVQFIDGERVCQKCTKYLMEAVGEPDEDDEIYDHIMDRFMRKE